MPETEEQNAPEQQNTGRDPLNFRDADDDFNINEFFEFDKDKEDDYAEEDMKDYDGVAYQSDPEPETQQSSDDEEEEEEDDLFNDIKPLDTGEEEEEEFTDADLALFNKKLGKDFNDVEELKKFLNEGDKKDAQVGNKNELEVAENVIAHLGPLLDRSRTSDEDLLRREFETIAANAGQDLTDEDVQYEIDEKIEKLRDTNQVDLRANALRQDLLKVYNEHKGKKDKIEAEKVAREAADRQAETEALQNAFAEIARRDSFFGIKPEKDIIREAYKKVNSGEYIKHLQSDKNALAKLAVIEAYEEQIHKKASSGLTYSDGIKAIRDEFKGVKEKSSGLNLTNAQKRGSAGSDSGRGLIESLTR